jgi:hypothetical protein
MTTAELASIFTTAAKAKVASEKGGQWEKKKGLLTYPQFLYGAALLCTQLLQLNEIPSILGVQGHIDWSQQFRVLVKNHVLPHVDPNSMPDAITEEFANPKVVSLLTRKLWPLKVVFNQYTTPIALSRHGSEADKCLYKNAGLLEGESEPSAENAIKGEDGRSMSLQQLLAFFKDFNLLPDEKPRAVTYSMSSKTLNSSKSMGSVSSNRIGNFGDHTSQQKLKGAVVNQDSIMEVFERVNAGVGGDDQLDRLCFAEFVEVLARCSVLYFPLADPAAQQRIAAGCIGAFKAGRMPLRTRSERAANRYWTQRSINRKASASKLEQTLTTEEEPGVRVKDPNAAARMIQLDEEERLRQQKLRRDARRTSRLRRQEEKLAAKYAEAHGGKAPTEEQMEHFYHEHEHSEEEESEESSSDEDEFDRGDEEDQRLGAMRSIFDDEETVKLHRQMEVMQLRWAMEQVQLATMSGQELGDVDTLMESLRQQGMEFVNEENIRGVFRSSCTVRPSSSTAITPSTQSVVGTDASIKVYQEQPVSFSFPEINNSAGQPEDEAWEDDEYGDEDEQPFAAINPSASMPALGQGVSLPSIGAATISGSVAGRERRSNAKHSMRQSQSERNFFHELGSGLIERL